MKLTEKIRNFISSNFYVPNPDMLGDDASLLDQGIIDSTGVLEVVAFLETEFSLNIADADMLPGNFDSIGNIARFIERKMTRPSRV